MKATINIRRSDLVRTNLALLPKLKSTYISIFTIALLTLGILYWKNGLPQTQIEWVLVLVGSIAGGLVGTFFGVVCSIVTILFMSSSKNGVLGNHEYTLTAEGLYEETSANEGLSKWSGVTEVRVVDRYLLIQINGYLFHVVPARSFSSKEKFEEFVLMAKEYWRNANNS